jgi:anti-sigma factor RsiW
MIFEDKQVRWKTKAMTLWDRIRNRQMMNCKDVVDLLTDYLANELPQKDVAGIRMHLAGCPNCNAFLDSLKTTVQWTRSLKPEDIPPEVVERLHAFLRSKTPPAR